MPVFEKIREKLDERPVRSDIEFKELISFAKHYKLPIKEGGKHPIKIYFPLTKEILVVPYHGKTVKECYVRDFSNKFEAELLERRKKEE